MGPLPLLLSTIWGCVLISAEDQRTRQEKFGGSGADDTASPEGWVTDEVEPNDAEIDADVPALTAPGDAQALPEGSGAGLVDTVQGAVTITTAHPRWSGDNDAFLVSVAEQVGMVASLTYDPTTEGDRVPDLDCALFDAEGTKIAAGWEVGNVDPEVFDTWSDYGFHLEPGETYYLVVVAEDGDKGEVPYVLELAWAAPE